MRYRDLLEGKWWDEGETITLYHGTSSAFLPQIERLGLLPPEVDLRSYALRVLKQYIPRQEWTPELEQDVSDGCARHKFGRAGDRGQVIYCFTGAKDVEGYATAYAEHGGEIACDVYSAAKRFRADPEMTAREFAGWQPPFPPRHQGAVPIVVRIEVPKAWCLFDTDLVALKKRITGLSDDPEITKRRLDSWMQCREIRVTRPVPVEMIKSIEHVQPKER